MANKVPLVSVYCMTYNQKNTIGQTIESILAQQTDFEFELIIHDDASTDGTAEIVRRYAEAYPHIIRPIFQEENQYRKCNLIQSFIHPAGRGTFIAICEGDDYWCDPKKLQIQADYMRSHPECMLTFHAVRQLTNEEETIVRPLKRSGIVLAPLIVKRGGQFCPTVSSFFRKEVMDLWPEFRVNADVYDYPAQVLAASMGTVYYMDRIMGVYRFASAGSWTAEYKDQVNDQHIQNETEWLALFDDYTAHRYNHEIRYHIAHMWLTEYRKCFLPEVRRKAMQYIRTLPLGTRLFFGCMIAAFSALGKSGNKAFEILKKHLLR